MLDAKYATFIDTVRADDQVLALAQYIEAFRKVEATWQDASSSSPVVAAGEIQDLDRTMRDKSAWRRTKSNECYFWIDNFQAVVRITTPSPIRSKTRTRLEKLLRQCVSRSHDRFAATHDDLTGLFNLSHAESILESRMRSVFSIVQGASPTSPSDPFRVCVLAIDADHFKQLNDTYGHLYGDVVLQCISLRLDTICRTFTTHEVLSVACRAGGEEFLLMMIGQFDAGHEIEFAHAVHLAISATPLPSDAELGQRFLSGVVSSLTVPPVTQRTVTVSVGVASAEPASYTEHASLVSSLRKEADLALYSAKSHGRNQVRLYIDILEQYGRVLEHDTSTNTVAIDIGQQVGVSLGQEFLVRIPKYSGKMPFHQSDGRSSKVLGLYPRLTSGRIIVFNVQNDISFCRIADRHCVDAFPAGSSLEAVPLGSISHLLADQAMSLGVTPAIGTGEALVARLLKGKAAVDDKLIVVFRVHNESDTVSKYGSAAINEALATLYRVVQGEFPESLIAQTQPTEISVLISDPSSECASTVKRILEGEAFKTVQFVAGVSPSHDEIGALVAADQTVFREEHLLEYARYAAAIANLDAPQMHVFGKDSPMHLLSALRLAKQRSRALEDYRQLRNLGIVNGAFENVALILMIEDQCKDHALVTTACETCLQNLPEDRALLNVGLAYHVVGDRAGCAAAFEQYVQRRGFSDISGVYMPALALSFARSYYHEARDIPVAYAALIEMLESIDKLPNIPYVARSTITSAIEHVRAKGEQLVS